MGGAGTAACSGDLLLGALAACAQLTCQMVATAMGLEVRSIETTVEGDLDLRGTLGLDREVGAGFSALRLRFAVDAPEASEEDLDALLRKTERYCTVAQTLMAPPALEVEMARLTHRGLGVVRRVTTPYAARHSCLGKHQRGRKRARKASKTATMSTLSGSRSHWICRPSNIARICGAIISASRPASTRPSRCSSAQPVDEDAPALRGSGRGTSRARDGRRRRSPPRGW